VTFAKGLDVSSWQATTPQLAGLAFAFARATYGTSKDTRFDQHAAAFRSAGIVSGAYAFGVGDKNATDQANIFLATAGRHDLLALDLESNGSIGPSMSAAQAKTFIETVQYAGRKIGLYHSDSGFPELGQDWNWVAKWGNTPPARPWSFWQVQGSPLDLDVFNGPAEALAVFAGADTLTLRANSITPTVRKGDVAQGVQVYTLARQPLVQMSAPSTLTSVGQSGDMDIVIITTSGVTQYGLILSTQFTNPQVVGDASAVAILQAKIAAAQAALA
jgi:hypothetical protein